MTTRLLIAHLRALWRTERATAELRLKRLLSNLGLQALAVLIFACALLLFELAAYFALVQRWDAIWSAVALGTLDLILAGVVVLFALRRPVSRELILAAEMHRQAIEAFEADLHGVGPASISSVIETAVVPALLPLIPLLIERLHKYRADPASEKAA